MSLRLHLQNHRSSIDPKYLPITWEHRSSTLVTGIPHTSVFCSGRQSVTLTDTSFDSGLLMNMVTNGKISGCQGNPQSQTPTQGVSVGEEEGGGGGVSLAVIAELEMQPV